MDPSLRKRQTEGSLHVYIHTGYVCHVHSNVFMELIFGMAIRSFQFDFMSLGFGGSIFPGASKTKAKLE